MAYRHRRRQGSYPPLRQSVNFVKNLLIARYSKTVDRPLNLLLVATIQAAGGCLIVSTARRTLNQGKKPLATHLPSSLRLSFIWIWVGSPWPLRAQCRGQRRSAVWRHKRANIRPVGAAAGCELFRRSKDREASPLLQFCGESGFAWGGLLLGQAVDVATAQQ